MKSTIGPWNHATRPAFALLISMMLASTLSCGGTRLTSGDATAAQQAPSAAAGSGQPAPAPAATAEAAPGAAPATQSTAAQPYAAAPDSGTSPASTEAPATPPAAAAMPATGAATAPATAPQPIPVRAQRQLGELVFTEGSVSIQRAGAQVERADIGSIVRAYDVLVTGPKSRAEVDLGSGSAGGATVKLAANTAFYFDTKELSDAQRKTVLQLLSGALAVKVDKLANGTFQIGTDSAVLGVRGTVFIVDTIPDGSLLVTCESGAVAVTEGGQTTTAKPGGVVELTETGSLKLLAVQPEDLGSYRGTWTADAYKSFASRALTYTSTYAAALDAGKPAFDAALAKLKAQKPALDAWRTARASEREPRFTDWIAEKKAVAPVLFDCLKALFTLERPYYRLVELKTLHEAGTGTGALKDGRSSAAYFSGFNTSNASLALGMANVREALLLFSWVSADSPLGEFFGAKAASLGTGRLLLED